MGLARSQPFARARALFAEIQKALKLPLSIDQHLALAALPEYKSRGKGGKHRAMQRSCLSREMQDRSRYCTGNARSHRWCR